MAMLNLFSSICILFLCCLYKVHGCTTFAVGKDATIDGSTMGTHTNDGGGTTDGRLIKIDAQDYPSGSLRPIYGSPEDYPRYVGTARKVSQYFVENCEAGPSNCVEFEALGYIPQVEHTYAYIEATYGIVNEHQVGLGESTCSGVYAALSVGRGGKALLSIDQLSQIAMERSTTAREAIQIMGDLAVEYGFYGESSSFEGGSESLVVNDPTEAWVFHILADPTGTSAIWAAARVPDDSVAVVANMFSIREMNLDDKDNFMGRPDMWELAETEGLWLPTEPKDFTKTFSDGEYAHKYYSGRRMWGVFNRLSPSANLPSEYVNLKEDAPYPFSVRVDHKINVSDAFSVLRDWYEGTIYSPTADGVIAGGAFSTADRYSGSVGEAQVGGSWERTIALFRSSDTFVVQARGYVPNNLYGAVVWFGPHAAHGTAYVPVVVGMTTMPDCLAWTYQGVYNASVSFWAHRMVLNFAQVKFSYMMQDIKLVQNQLEAASLKLLNQLSVNISDVHVDVVTQLLTDNANANRDAFIQLFYKLLFQYADGYNNRWVNGAFSSSSMGYPAWWLEQVGYADGPPPVERK